MAKKKRGGGHGGHGWFVTFADLMALEKYRRTLQEQAQSYGELGD